MDALSLWEAAPAAEWMPCLCGRPPLRPKVWSGS